MEFSTVTLVFVVSFILIVAVRIKRYFTHKRRELEKSIYIHKKSGNSYIKLGSVSEQIDGVWHTTKIVYKNKAFKNYHINNLHIDVVKNKYKEVSSTLLSLEKPTYSKILKSSDIVINEILSELIKTF
mgnify:CR=1 FL=1